VRTEVLVAPKRDVLELELVDLGVETVGLRPATAAELRAGHLVPPLPTPDALGLECIGREVPTASRTSDARAAARLAFDAGGAGGGGGGRSARVASPRSAPRPPRAPG
jgi:hypothetical protein